IRGSFMNASNAGVPVRPESIQPSHPVADPANRLTDAEIARFHADGFLIRKKFFTVDEITPLIDACHADPDVDGAVSALSDSRGQPQEVATWTRLGNDLCGVFPRVARMVEAAESLLNLPVYHWHSKLSMKRPGSSGSWDWHQDFGYWYGEGTL